MPAAALLQQGGQPWECLLMLKGNVMYLETTVILSNGDRRRATAECSHQGSRENSLISLRRWQLWSPPLGVAIRNAILAGECQPA